MDAPASPKVLYLVGVGLFLIVDLLTFTYSQGDVWFSVNGTTYQNNSLVTLEDIGEENDALLCLTNLTGVNGSVRGNWYFPNGTTVFSTQEIHQTGGLMVVRLNRRRGGVEGIYHCVIPDSMNVTQTIYIGVYSASSGSPTVTSLSYNDQSRTLTCTSTGGPATTVTWRRDGVMITPNATHQQTKSVVDPIAGTYQTVLTIDPTVSQDDIVGIYNCTVENDRGESSETVDIPDADDVQFSLNGTTYQNNSIVALEDIGENDTALLCMTNFAACCRGEDGSVLGQWFFPNGTKLPSIFVNQTSQPKLKWDFYRTREKMMVLLHRRRGGVAGIYYCKIPDSMNVTRTIYIGVYNTSTGDFMRICSSILPFTQRGLLLSNVSSK